MGVLVLLLCLVSYLITALLVWLVSLITPLAFSWGVAFIVWLILLIIKLV